MIAMTEGRAICLITFLLVNSTRTNYTSSQYQKNPEDLLQVYISDSDAMTAQVNSTELGYKALAGLRECCRQTQAEVVSYSRNKIHET